MKVEEIRSFDDQDSCGIQARIIPDRRDVAPFDCWMRFPPGCRSMLTDSADPFLALTLLPAMILDEPLYVDGAVSPTLLASSERLQQIYRRWVTGARMIPVTARSIAPDTPLERKDGVGCFFSGGVDSFHTLLTHERSITHLVLISGFDKGLRNPAVLEKTCIALREVAAAFGKQPVEVSTNIRHFTDPLASWSFYHGGVLAAVALALSRGAGSFLVPSSYSYDQLHPWGSHPLLDPLWSLPGLQMVHDGCEFMRYEKISRIAGEDLALRHLRVCWDTGQGSDFNCGKCEKCLRTMLSLYLNGALDRCPTFPTPLVPRAFSSIRIRTEGQMAFMQENLRELALRPGRYDRALHRALSRAMWRGRIRRAARALVGKS